MNGPYGLPLHKSLINIPPKLTIITGNMRFITRANCSHFTVEMLGRSVGR